MDEDSENPTKLAKILLEWKLMLWHSYNDGKNCTGVLVGKQLYETFIGHRQQQVTPVFSNATTWVGACINSEFTDCHNE